MRGKLIILTGHTGIGKSSICRRVCALASEKGYRISGILSPPLYDDSGLKVGFLAEKISDGEKWELARNDNNPSAKGPVWGQYTFSEKGFRKAVRALKQGLSGKFDLIVLDEVGPLELLQGKGFRPFMDLLVKENQTDLLIVVRPTLIKEIQEVLKRNDIILFHAYIKNRNKLPSLIVDELRCTENVNTNPSFSACD
ncbi:MAG: hypothetical protein JSV25_03415 [Spirochaetota bacterium]|nr:MAG: hypothetical protein JSV25_03415 [Spirochaetota bacterium]